MAKKIFNGIKQVTADKFNEAKDAGLLGGYLWFVRTPVADGETNDVANDEYDIYFGSKQYSHFQAGELDAIRRQIESLNGDITAINNALEGLVDLADKAQTAIAQEVEDRKAADSTLDEKITANEGKIKDLEDADTTIRSEFAAADTALEKAYQAADAEMGARITVIEGNDAGKSMREVAVDELAKQLLGETNAEDNFKTLQELAAWLEQHPEDVTTMNAAIDQNAKDIATNANAIAKNAEDVTKNTAAITKNAEGIVELNNKVGDLEAADTALDGKITALDTKVNGIPVIETLTVNGVNATINDGAVDVKIEADDIELGTAITSDGNIPNDDRSNVIHAVDTKLSIVLQGIYDSISGAEAGGVHAIVAADKSVLINSANKNNPTVKVQLSTDENNLLSVDETGLFAAMYYEGDDE